ncbi:MAG: delta-lactam-biosynthetic de-N-acetylase [Thermoanaerobacteraceae bacterium]|nr:delta-lactam-biosynthetic de-N-acetylase [Thermoanaerobacteraceae bacterium]
MRRKLLFFMLALLLILSGCSYVKKPQEPVKQPVQSRTNNININESDRVDEISEGDSQEQATIVPEDTDDKNATETQMEDKNNQEQTNPESNEKSEAVEKPIGWGMVRNSEHKTPTISKTTRELVDKYEAIFTGDESSKVVYLTFDEGYENGYTPTILDILNDRGVKAAFFVTGSYVKQHPDYVKRMIDEGHIVGNHTMTHPSLPTITDEKIKQELNGVDELLMAKVGVKTKYLRPPMGEYTERTLKAAKEMGYTTVFWSLAFKDWLPLPGGPKESYDTVMNNLHPGAVILLHAESKDNTEALPKIIDSIREEGYEFKTLDDIN